MAVRAELTNAGSVTSAANGKVPENVNPHDIRGKQNFDTKFHKFDSTKILDIMLIVS